MPVFVVTAARDLQNNNPKANSAAILDMGAQERQSEISPSDPEAL